MFGGFLVMFGGFVAFVCSLDNGLYTHFQGCKRWELIEVKTWSSEKSH